MSQPYWDEFDWGWRELKSNLTNFIWWYFQGPTWLFLGGCITFFSDSIFFLLFWGSFWANLGPTGLSLGCWQAWKMCTKYIKHCALSTFSWYFITLLSGFLKLCQQVILLQEVFLHRLPPWNNMRYSISVWCQVRQSWSTVTMGEESCNGYHILVGRILRVMSMSLIMDQPCLWQCMKLGGRTTQKVVISHIVWLLEWVRI